MRGIFSFQHSFPVPAALREMLPRAMCVAAVEPRLNHTQDKLLNAMYMNPTSTRSILSLYPTANRWRAAATGLARVASIAFAVAAGFSSIVANAAPGSAAASRQSAMLCADARDTLAGNADLRNAQTAAFGANAHFQPDNQDGECIFPAAVLKFNDNWVMISAALDAGLSSSGQIGHLSAYFLQKAGGTLRLTGARRNFADSEDSWGRAGDIAPAHFGPDDGMAISGGGISEGYSTKTAAMYAFRHGDIISLGWVPIFWGNGGAMEDDSKVVSIEGKVQTGLSQPDRVRVVYVRKAAGRRITTTAIWRSDGGKFVLEAGTVPREIIASFDLPKSAVAKNGTAIPAADAAPSEGR